VMIRGLGFVNAPGAGFALGNGKATGHG